MGSMHWSIRGRRPRHRPLEPRTRKLPRVSEEILVRAETRYAAGATLRAIAKELGLGREQLASLLRTRGCACGVQRRRTRRSGRWSAGTSRVNHSIAWGHVSGSRLGLCGISFCVPGRCCAIHMGASQQSCPEADVVRVPGSGIAGLRPRIGRVHGLGWHEIPGARSGRGASARSAVDV